MDIRKIKKLIDLIDETGVAEIEIHEGEESVRICRSIKQTTVVNYSDPHPPHAVESPVTTTNPSAPNNQTSTLTQDNLGGHVITAPMVGTVYFAASPEAEPFTGVDQEIAVGDVVCIIEAMKMFNEIETDISGIVREIHVENAQPVEFGQPLFTIDID